MLNKNYTTSQDTISEALSYIEEVTTNLDKFNTKHNSLDYTLELKLVDNKYKVEIQLHNEKRYKA